MTRFLLNSVDGGVPGYAAALRAAGFAVEAAERSAEEYGWAQTVHYIEIETAADMIRAIETARAHNPEANAAIVVLKAYDDESVPGLRIYDGWNE